MTLWSNYVQTEVSVTESLASATSLYWDNFMVTEKLIFMQSFLHWSSELNLSSGACNYGSQCFSFSGQCPPILILSNVLRDYQALVLHQRFSKPLGNIEIMAKSKRND